MKEQYEIGADYNLFDNPIWLVNYLEEGYRVICFQRVCDMGEENPNIGWAYQIKGGIYNDNYCCRSPYSDGFIIYPTTREQFIELTRKFELRFFSPD